MVENLIKAEIRDLWRPTKQQVDDMAIMDIVHQRIPTWAWSGINRCRLFLRANTIADIVSLDGTSIMEDVRTVKNPIREKNYKFIFNTGRVTQIYYNGNTW